MPSPRHGSAETGILQRRRTPVIKPTLVDEYRRASDADALAILGSPNHAPLSRQALAPRTPNTSMFSPLTTPHTGVAGEKNSHFHSPTPAFPIKIQSISADVPKEQQEPSSAMITSTPSVTMENIDHNVHLYRGRQLSTFDEESETESLHSMTQNSTHMGSDQSSPSHVTSPRALSRKILSTRSSPNVLGPSKSDASDEDDDRDEDGIMELMTTSGRFPNKSGTFPRLSPSNSPLLTSRRSPTHYLTGSSDDEIASVFDSTRKSRSKRPPFRKRSVKKVARVDSMSSDDGISVARDVRTAHSSRKERLLRLRHYNSLPTTPNDNLVSDSLTNLLENIRRERSGSVPSNSSQSDGGPCAGKGDRDMNDLANSIVSKFELSDDDVYGCSIEHSMETCEAGKGSTALTNGGNRNLSCNSSPCISGKLTTNNTTLRSVFCSIL